jgi:hypothetical protein
VCRSGFCIRFEVLRTVNMSTVIFCIGIIYSCRWLPMFKRNFASIFMIYSEHHCNLILYIIGHLYTLCVALY